MYSKIVPGGKGSLDGIGVPEVAGEIAAGVNVGEASEGGGKHEAINIEPSANAGRVPFITFIVVKSTSDMRHMGRQSPARLPSPASPGNVWYRRG